MERPRPLRKIGRKVDEYIDRHVEAGIRYGPDDLTEGYVRRDGNVIQFPIGRKPVDKSNKER